MKKFDIIFLSFTIPFFIVWLYLDMVVDLQNVYWLFGKLICLLLLIIVPAVYRIVKKETHVAIGVVSACFLLFWLWRMGSRDIEKYKNNVCQGQFGKEFNARRQSRGIPVIPPDLGFLGRDKNTTDWEAKAGFMVIGHSWKTTTVDSNCQIVIERDDYNLKPIQESPRSISISTTYAKGKGRDSISFDYEVFGVPTKTISRQQADSIFAAEKIQKDY